METEKIDRSMKTIYINHAKEHGADDNLLKKLADYDYQTVRQIVEMYFGDLPLGDYKLNIE